MIAAPARRAFGAAKREPSRSPRPRPRIPEVVQPEAWGATSGQRALILGNLLAASF
jgi:hypothetical protein